MAAVELKKSTLYSDAQLIQYLQFEDNLTDTKGSYNGIDVGTVTFAAGKFGKSAVLNGSSQAIDVANAAAIEGNTTFSIMFWLYLDALPTSGNFYALIGNHDHSGDPGYYVNIYNNSGTQTLEWVISDGTPCTCSEPYAFSTGTWYQIVVSSDGSNQAMYVNDGLLKSVGSAKLVPSAHVYKGYIGYYPVLGSRFVDGMFDDYAYFNRLLSSTEISNHYNGLDAVASGGSFLLNFI